MRNLRQYKGIYDPDVTLPNNRSKAYPKLTRVKCVSMLSRLMNLLFPTGQRNWAVQPTPVPNLDPADLAMVLQSMPQDPNEPVEDAQIEEAIRVFARERAKNLEREMDDQLAELGGDRMVDYVSLCRKVLMSGIIYGIGILKGPFVRMQDQRRWSRDPMTGMLTPISVQAMRPHFEHISVWDYYPDMSARYLHRMDGQFTRYVMTRQQLRELADREDFFGDVILQYLKDHRKGNYKHKPFESELKSLGVQLNVNDQFGRKYELIVWDGHVSGHYLRSAGVDIPDEQLSEQVMAVVWMLENEVIKADLSPWQALEPDSRINTFHHFVFEEDESSILGNGLPSVMRDSQMAVAAASRMALDNAGVVCGPNLEVNTDLMRLDQDITNVHSYKIWYREGTGPEAGLPAVRGINIDSHIPELINIISLFRDFADQETFVSQATGGDIQKGPSEPFRTAAGASMLRGEAALPFKDVVRNFDLFTQSVISSLVMFNKHFNDKPDIRGDFQVMARGSSSLIAKEVRGIAYDALAQTLRPEEAKYINWREMAKERFSVRDIDIGAVLVDDESAQRIDEQSAEQAKATEDRQVEMVRAEIRKTLAEAVKNLTQADKNSAMANAQVYNSILGGLEKGVTPENIAAARAGSGTSTGPSAVPGGAGDPEYDDIAPRQPGEGQGEVGDLRPVGGMPLAGGGQGLR
jgi:hypothetical protein